MKKNYSLITIRNAVKVYLNGHDSLRSVAKRFNISKTTLNRWVAKYKEHGLKAFLETCTNYSLEFKMDVINYMYDTGASIEETAAKFNVSSSGVVNNWLKLYETQGIDALLIKNKRERLSMVKKKQVQNDKTTDKSLQAENERLRMENAYLKKLHALIQEKEKLQNKKKHK